tara:strand:- start:89 stop:220 length:132 start_codon:yes stop_codon:yes gene_type:complete
VAIALAQFIMATSLAAAAGKENPLHEIAAPPLIHLIVPIKVKL